MPVVYALIHKPSGFAYIGCTAGKLSKRLREHRCLLNARQHAATKLQEDWLRDGEHAFELVVLEKLPDTASVVDKRASELYWMQHYSLKGLLYNINQTSFSPTPESIAKRIQASAKSPKRKTEEYRRQRSLVAQRTIASDATRKKHSERLLKLWQDPEFRAKKLNDLDRGRAKTNERQRALTHCKQGHPLSDDNVYICKSTGYRACRTCRRIWVKASKERRKVK
jgi:group I intron endonuclease